MASILELLPKPSAIFHPDCWKATPNDQVHFFKTLDFEPYDGMIFVISISEVQRQIGYAFQLGSF